MWRAFWASFRRRLRDERGAIVFWWFGAEAASEVSDLIYGLTHLAGETVVFVHERMTLFVASGTPPRRGVRFPIGFKTLVP